MRVIILAGASNSLIGFRQDLIKAIIRNGHEVVCIGPESGVSNGLNKIGAEFVQCKFNRSSMNPITVICTVVKLKREMKKLNADLYFGYTDTPATLGVIAAWRAGIGNRYAMLTGIGSYYDNPQSVKERILGFALKYIMKYSLFKCKAVIFQNPDDKDVFCSNGMCLREMSYVVNGSGVNLDYYRKEPLPVGNFKFLFVGALMKQKGIEDFIDAATIVNAKYPQIEFDIVGGLSNRISSISQVQLDKISANNVFNYLGQVDDVRPYLKECSCFVLPSYREGVPRSGLEALATGRPIITTNAPGCKEIVADKKNGLIVSIANTHELSEAMIWIFEHKKKLYEMSEESYLLAKNRFDVNIVNKDMLNIMKM